MSSRIISASCDFVVRVVECLCLCRQRFCRMGNCSKGVLRMGNCSKGVWGFCRMGNCSNGVVAMQGTCARLRRTTARQLFVDGSCRRILRKRYGICNSNTTHTRVVFKFMDVHVMYIYVCSTHTFHVCNIFMCITRTNVKS